MGLFRNNKDHAGTTQSNSPLVNAVCERLGVSYGGWETIGPLPTGEKGTEVSFHIDDGNAVAREPFLQGTGVVRHARAYADRVEIWDGETLLATYNDLSVSDVFAR